MLSVELYDYKTIIKNFTYTDPDGIQTTSEHLYDLKTKSETSFSGTTKGTVIFERDIRELPPKFLEYLEVRVALILTEMYPRDGIDVQRLPRLERELEAYFKDRQNDEGNYNIFDSYATSSRIGINRNYELV
jgi:hypothetical protein